MKTLVAFAVLGLAVAGAKSYEITLNQATKAGNVDLKPGKYNVAVDGSKVRFRSESGKTTETDATVASNDKKYRDTIVSTTQKNGEASINEIDLGGTNTKLQFAPGSGNVAAQ